MKQFELRTYHRRKTTRTSGYHTCDNSTGGECIVKKSSRATIIKGKNSFIFKIDKDELIELFNKNISIFAFGGYIYPFSNINVNFSFSYNYEEKKINKSRNNWQSIDKNK
jgi:hypothetical protein